MKLLLVGSDKIFAIENFYLRYLQEWDVEVALFPAHSLFYDYYQKNDVHKLWFKLGLSDIYTQICKQLEQFIEVYKPDLVWIFKGMEITPSLLKRVKGKGIKLVNYNPDNPFIFTGKGSGNRNILPSLPLYDLHFTYNHEIAHRLEKEYQARIEFLPFGFDVDEKTLSLCQAEKEIVKGCFLGNPDEQRASFIRSLADHIPLDVYGNKWDRFPDHPNIILKGPVLGTEVWKTLYKYRFQLNLMRIHNEDAHNMRSLEIPGIGGIQLAPATRDHKTFFTEGKDIFLYDSLQDCVDKAKFLINLPEHEAREIRIRAREQVLQAGFAYKNLANKARSILEKLLNNG